MWQVLLAAAVAGSTSLVAKHLLDTKKCGDHDQEEEKEENPVEDGLNGSIETGYESKSDAKGGIFRFSSPESSGKTESHRSGGKNARKKKGIVVDGAKKVENKRFGVCLKRRKTTKNVAATKCGSCSSKGSSLFGWGLGVGMVYIMSAGKSEISKLNTAMDETAKVVRELKTELYKRKSSQVSFSADEVAANSNKISGKHTEVGLSKSNTGNPNNLKVFVPPVSDDGECGSSALTEEPAPEVLEMNRLEAELESELQKLPWCTTESSFHEELRSNLIERNVAQTEISVDELHELEHASESYQYSGVLPSELDKKLCHVLIEQQESQIVELESELHLAQSKLQEKEAELQALKDCVRRLTEVSLSNGSDDESLAQQEQVCTNKWDCNIKMVSESRKSVIGMKRSIDS